MSKLKWYNRPMLFYPCLYLQYNPARETHQHDTSVMNGSARPAVDL